MANWICRAFERDTVILTPDDLERLRRGETVECRWGPEIKVAENSYMHDREFGDWAHGAVE